MRESDQYNIEVFYAEKIRLAVEKNPFERIGDIVYESLEDAIISSRLPPGSKLNIAKLASQLHVSATPVREAIERLVVNGLVSVEKKDNGKYSNYYVFDISDQSIIRLFQARSALESAAAAICASEYWLVDVSRLEQNLEKFQSELERVVSGEQKNLNGPRVLDREFHSIIVEESRNPYIMGMHRALNRKIEHLSVRTMEFILIDHLSKENLSFGYQHRCVLNAIKLGFQEQARLTMDEHLTFCAHVCLKNRNLIRLSNKI